MKKNMKNNQGVTLIVLVVTIIVMLILCGASLQIVLGGNGLIDNVRFSAFETKIKVYQDEIRTYLLSQDLYGNVDNNENSYINDIDLMKNILDDATDEEAEKYGIEDNKLVYKPDKVTDEEREWLERLGIEPMEAVNN